MAQKNTVTPEEKQRVAALCLDTFRKLDVPELIPELTITWSNKMTSALGYGGYTPTMAKHGKAPSAATVQFSIPLWLRATEEERDETVVHEICHVVVAYKNGGLQPRSGRRRRPHGAEWKAMMRKAGVEPRRCHNVDNSDLKQKRKKQERVKAWCDCQVHMITKQRAGRMRNGKGYICKKCKGKLSLVPKGSVLGNEPFLAALLAKTL